MTKVVTAALAATLIAAVGRTTLIDVSLAVSMRVTRAAVAPWLAIVTGTLKASPITKNLGS